MSLTRPQIRGKLLLRIDGLGGKREATTIESDGIIDPTSFRRTESGDGDFQGAVMYRPNVAEVDQFREAGLVNGSKLLHTGDAYAFNQLSDRSYEIYYLLHPLIVNECIRRAPLEIYGESHVPLTLWEDGDLSSPDITPWDNGTIVAPTKSSSPAYKFIGNHRSLVVTTSGGNLYAESDAVGVDPGEDIFHAAIGSLDSASSGTLYYALWDKTNNRAIYEATFSSYRDQIIRRQDTIPSDCLKVAIRVGATANGVTTVWKGFPSHRIGEGNSNVQSWLKEQMNLLGFGPCNYYDSTGDDRYAAQSRTWEQWERGADYRLFPFVPASNYYSLQIDRPGGLDARDYWIHGWRRMADIEEELDDEAAASNIDEDWLITAAEALICEQLGPDYAVQASRAREKLSFQRISRPPSQPKRETTKVRLNLRQ